MDRKAIEVLAVVIAFILCLMALDAWHSARVDQQQLQTTLATQQKVISDANNRESQREDSLQVALAEISKLKAKTQTPSQVLSELPQYLPLPEPIAVQPAELSKSDHVHGSAASSPTGTAKTRDNSYGLFRPDKGSDSSPTPERIASDLQTALQTGGTPPDHPGRPNGDIDLPNAILPSADLKPLFDFVQDCRVCGAELTAARQDAADNAAKLTAVTKERAAAINAAKGGSFWRRLRQNAEWLAAGAAIGYIALRNKA